MKGLNQIMVRVLFGLGITLHVGCDDHLLDEIIDQNINPPNNSDDSDQQQEIITGPISSDCSPSTRSVDDDLDPMSLEFPVSITVEGSDVVVFNPNAVFNCCLDAWMEARVELNRIVVVEKETSDTTNACRCMCGRELGMTIPDLEDGDYTVLVYHQEEIEARLLAEQRMTIGARDTDATEHDEPIVANLDVSDCKTSAPEAFATAEVETEENEESTDGTLDDEITYIMTHGDTVTFYDKDVEMNCCADIDVRVSFDGFDITIREIEVPEENGLCWCLCPRDVSAVIEGLSLGEYTVYVVREFDNGEVIALDPLRFKCITPPSNWAYTGITCIN